MLQSSHAECPVCGLSFPLKSVNVHVEECLAKTELNNNKTFSNAQKGLSAESEKKQELTETSWFTQGQRSKLSSSPKMQEKSPQSQLKRDVSNLAGKPTAPPNKKLKTDPKKGHLKGFGQGLFSQAYKDAKNPFVILSKTKEVNSKTTAPNPDVDKRKSAEGGASKERARTKGDFVPLAERMRPSSLDEYVGQSKVLGNSSLLRTLLQANEVPSMILWGPPGCGKTSLAHIIASSVKKSSTTRFVTLSATTSGINDIKEVVKVAKNEQQMFKRKTILFVDEIHRFNKTQQDTFLPHVENGTITLIGATTENPSFQLNTALLSRCRVIVLEKLSVEDLQQILFRAVGNMESVIVDGEDEVKTPSDDWTPVVAVEREAIIALANLCDGDARVALNGLQLAIQSQIATSTQAKSSSGCNSKGLDLGKPVQTINGHVPSKSDISECEKDLIKVNVSHIKEGLQRTHLLYDRAGEEHYNIISALHKSLRGSDVNAALYWLARMLVGGEDPLYIARRLVRFASEDVGLADPTALNQTVAAYQACHFIGMPECEVILAQATVYLARAPKSIEVYSAYAEAKHCVKNWDGPHPSVPLHIRNAPTKLMKKLGYGAGYKYNPAFDGHVDQTYLPTELSTVDFFTARNVKSCF